MRTQKTKWIPRDLKKGRVDHYVRRLYGSRGFKQNGNLKKEYVLRAKKEQCIIKIEVLPQLSF